MLKKGQLHLSFGMIFSIIIIIAIIGVAIYFISNFLGTTKCVEVGFFYDNLKTHIEKAWRSTIHQDTFADSLPSEIELVCFGNFTQTPLNEYKDEYEYLKRRYFDKNLFLYPPQKACDGELSSFSLDHIKTNNFFCVPVKEGKAQIKTEKGNFDSLVTISP